MSFRIDGNKIFIDAQNQQDKLGLVCYSEKSHKFRELISKILSVFCCCFRISQEYQKNGQNLRYDPYFKFETFTLSCDKNVFYVKKADYVKWKQNNQYPSYESNFSYDFLELVRLNKPNQG